MSKKNEDSKSAGGLGPFRSFNEQQLGLMATFKELSKGLSKGEACDVLNALGNELGFDLVRQGQIRVASVIATMTQSMKDKGSSESSKKLPKAKSKKAVTSGGKDPLFEQFIAEEGRDLFTHRNGLKDLYGKDATAEQKGEISQATAALRAAFGIFRDSRANPTEEDQAPPTPPASEA
jgi:hypothetical protein